MADPFERPVEILHVDDDPNILELTGEFLEREADSFEVVTETGAETALGTISERDIDCIVSDYNMPEMNGIEFLESIRADRPDLPFILYTGKGSEEIASEAISAGVTDYLQKATGTDQYTVLANRIENAVAQYRAQQELEETTRFYRTILEHSSDYVMIVDKMGEVTYISPAVERVLGYSPDELQAMDAFEFVHPDDVNRAITSLQKNMEHPDQEHTVEFRAQHADGSWRWLEVRGRSLIDDPVISGIIVNVRDITTRKKREQALEQQKERLENLTSFLSHDVRNQLSIVDGNVTLAQENHDSESLATASTALDRIEEMMEKIIELTQSGKLPSELTTVELASVVNACRTNVGDEDITLVTESSMTIKADTDRLRSLFENLILNAIEHGDAETVRIGTLPGEEGKVGFYVADDGVGLSVEETDRLFETDYTTSEEGTGSGFGLAIVKEIAETHDWSIDVTESTDGGVRFEFTDVSVVD
jgi:PAS domain S-box-containing protein